MRVGIQHKANIFDRNQHKQGPEDKRHSAKDIIPRDRNLSERMCPKENLSEGIEDRSPNIPKNDPPFLKNKKPKRSTKKFGPGCFLGVGFSLSPASNALISLPY